MTRHSSKLFSAPVSGTKVEVSATRVALNGYHIVNLTAALCYIQIFNALAANVTVGTTVPYVSIPLPASGGATLYLGGWNFSALTIACTTDHNNAASADAFVVLSQAL